jgi:hypothetical protein
MADPMTGPITRCPWCSAELAAPDVELCPSCGAALVTQPGGANPDIKGVTTLDTEAILRARSEVTRPRSRILSFITGDTAPEAATPDRPESLAPPPNEVRREMLRLELEAERADLEAQSLALKSDVLAREGIHLSQLGGADEPAVVGEPEAGDEPASPDAAPWDEPPGS